MIDRFAVHSKIFVLVATVALGACGGGGGGTDTGLLADGAVNETTPQGDSSVMDSGMTDLDSGNATDATDGRRVRDMGPEINLNNEAGMCFAAVNPRRGPASTDFVVEGMFFPPMVNIAIIGPGGNVLVPTTPVTVTGGSFAYHFMRAGLATGDYTASVTDPVGFVCGFDAPFTVQ